MHTAFFAELTEITCRMENHPYCPRSQEIAGWSSPVARQAHNLKVVGSNPTPATNFENLGVHAPGFLFAPMNTPKPHRVYVIQNPAKQIYIGLSEDVFHRLAQHNDGISKWTKGKGPWTLIWTSEALSLSDARKLENLLKRQKGGVGFYRFTGITRSSCS